MLARATLGDDGFNAARAEGRAYPISTIADLVSSVSPAIETQLPASSHTSARLSARELDVLRLLIAGYTDREIGETLFIGTRTVESHVARVCSKLGVHGRTATVVTVMNAGLIDRHG